MRSVSKLCDGLSDNPPAYFQLLCEEAGTCPRRISTHLCLHCRTGQTSIPSGDSGTTQSANRIEQLNMKAVISSDVAHFLCVELRGAKRQIRQPANLEACSDGDLVLVKKATPQRLLLRGVNDDLATLSRLYDKRIASTIRPPRR